MTKSVLSVQPWVRQAIASRFRAGDSIGRLAWDYDRKPTEIQRAIREEWLGERERRKRKVRR